MVISFKNIINQEQIKRQLLRLHSENRLPHALLFNGYPGSGDLAVVLAFAKYLSCQNPGEGDACHRCVSCMKFDKLAHPDVHFYFPTASNPQISKKNSSKAFLTEWRSLILQNPYADLTNWFEKAGVNNKQGLINVDDCNSIIKELSYKAFESEYKIIVIWMIEKLFYSAAPKLLKILEEPPQKTMFLMVTHQRQNVLATILSRTQSLNIQKLKEKEIAYWLKNQKNIDSEKAIEIAFLADGNLNRAIELSENDITQSDAFEDFAHWMRICYAHNYLEISAWVNKVGAYGREKLKNFILYAVKLIRSCLIINYTGNLENLSKTEKEFIKKFSPFINETNIQAFYHELNQAYHHIVRNANAKLVFMDLSLNFSTLLKNKKTS